MGRYDFRPHHVNRLAAQIIDTSPSRRTTLWQPIITAIPPPEPLIRTRPIPHNQKPRRTRCRKPSKMYLPQNITYEEDRLRTTFFKDHPWELARPRMTLENDGKDHEKMDWLKIKQSEKQLDGESVIRRQLQLHEIEPDRSQVGTYEQARKEFYKLRLQEDTERRVAREEALHTGAQFGPSVMELGLEMENRQFDRWREWAQRELTKKESQNAAMAAQTFTPSPTTPAPTTTAA